MIPEDTRRSDRWVTPSVIVAGILTAGVVTLGLTAGLVFLQYKGVNPQPVIDLVTKIVTAIGALGSLLLGIANRATTAKTERNTGIIIGQTTPPDPPYYKDDMAPETSRLPHTPPVPGRE
jgi:hypothetical protein